MTKAQRKRKQEECKLYANKNEVAIEFSRMQDHERLLLQECSLYWLCWTIKGQDKADESESVVNQYTNKNEAAIEFSRRQANERFTSRTFVSQ